MKNLVDPLEPLPISCSAKQLSATPNLDRIREGALKALADGVLRARKLSWLHRSAEAARVLDHIHNLPSLIRCPQIEEALRFYNSYELMFGTAPPPYDYSGYADILYGCGFRSDSTR
jgi:hypothetical protein